MYNNISYQHCIFGSASYTWCPYEINSDQTRKFWERCKIDSCTENAIIDKNQYISSRYFIKAVITLNEDGKSTHESLTVYKDQPYELVCNAPNFEIKGCLFNSPTGECFVLWDGAS